MFMLNSSKSAIQMCYRYLRQTPHGNIKGTSYAQASIDKNQPTSTDFIIPIALRIRVTITVVSLVMVPRILATWWNLAPLIDAAIHLRVRATSQRDIPK